MVDDGPLFTRGSHPVQPEGASAGKQLPAEKRNLSRKNADDLHYAFALLIASAFEHLELGPSDELEWAYNEVKSFLDWKARR